MKTQRTKNPPRCFCRFHLLLMLLASGAFATASATAATVTKADVGTDLNDIGSWIGGVTPTAADTATWSGTSLGLGLTFTTNATWEGIRVLGAASDIDVTGTEPLSLGGGGIDASAATVNLTLGVPLSLAAGQVWDVNSGYTVTASGIISGDFSLNKTGLGTVTLSGANTYSGGTTISAGTLRLGIAGALGNGNVTVAGGATLDLNNFGLTTKSNNVLHIAGKGVGDSGAIVNNGSAQIRNGWTNLVLDADASIGGVGRIDVQPVGTTLYPGLNLGGHTLTKTGGNLIYLWHTPPVPNGNIVVESGTLGFSDVTITNPTSVITVKAGAELQFFRNVEAPSILTCPILLESGSTISYLGNNNADEIDQRINSPITLIGDATVGQSYGSGSVFELAGPISGAFNLTKSGPGIVMLSGTNSYVGTSITGGTILADRLGSGPVQVSGGKLGAGTRGVGTLSVAGDLTLDSCELLFDITNSLNCDKIVVAGSLYANGPTTITLSNPMPLPNGEYTLLEVAGALGGTADYFSVASQSLKTYAIAYRSGTPNRVVLQVSGPPSALTWVGDGSANQWDLASIDWIETEGTTPCVYQDNIAVTFGNQSTNRNITIPATVYPLLVTVNASNDYRFGGSGYISGTGGLTKSGTGLLTVATADDYTGAITINAGKLQIGDGGTSGSISNAASLANSGALIFNRSDVLAYAKPISGTGSLTQKGSGITILSGGNTYTGGTTISNGTLRVSANGALGAGPSTVASGATLDLFNNVGLTTKAGNIVHIAGTGVTNGGALANNGTAQCKLATTNLVLDADASIGGSGRIDFQPVGVVNPVLNLGTNTLTKVRGNMVWFWQTGVTNGNITVESGVLGLAGSSVTNPASLVKVKTGGELQFYRATQAPCTLSCPVTLQQGAVLSYSGQNTADAVDQSIAAPITLLGDATISQAGLAGSVFELAGTISGPFGLTKTGARTLQLSGTNLYSGNTVIAAGTLALAASGSIPNSTNILVGDGAGFDLSAAPGFALNSTQILSGGGTIIGVMSNTGTIAPGTNGIGTLTFTTAPAMNGTVAMEINRDAAQNSDRIVITNTSTLRYGGSLIVGNLSSSALQPGDSFQLFAASSYEGAFANIAYPPGYVFTNTLAVDGRIWVASTGANTPPGIPPGGLTRLADGNYSLSATGAIGTPFSLWASPNVSLSPVVSTWTRLTNGTITSTPFTIIDRGATNFPLRFYLFSTP